MIRVNNIVVIGGDNKADVVKWAECENMGLWTGYKITDVLEDGFKIATYNGVVNRENIITCYDTKEEFLKKLQEDLKNFGDGEYNFDTLEEDFLINK